MKEAEYVAVLRYWINFRYYVIEMHGKFYLLDYANPLDPRSYFSGLFPSYNQHFTLYDISDSLEDYPIKELSWWHSSTPQALELSSIFIFFGIGLLGTICSWLGWWFFQNEGLYHYWQWVVTLFLIGFMVIVFYLYQATRINLTLPEKSCRVKRVLRIGRGRKKKRQVRTVQEFFMSLLVAPGLLAWSLGNNYLLSLILFVQAYYMLLYRYINLYTLLQDHKFVIVPDK